MSLEIPLEFAHVALEFRHDLDPEPWYVTFGVATANITPDVEAIAAKASASFWDQFGDNFSSQVEHTAVLVTLGTGDDEPIRATVPTADLRGDNGAQQLPQNCALLITKSTALGGRRNKGRMFLPGILDDTSVSATGIIITQAMDGFRTMCDAFLTALASTAGEGSMPMVLLHSDGISSVPSPTVVSKLTPSNIISTQRRRLR